MEQTNKPAFWQIVTTGLLAAVCFGFARYFRLGGSPTFWGVSQFLATVGWLSGIGAILLMLVWAYKSTRS
jgi:hypothetical protein